MEEEKTHSKNKNFGSILVVIIVILAIGLYFYFQGYNPFSKKLKVDFPYTSNISQNVSFACESLVYSDVIGSPTEYLTDGIEGEVKKGTDTIAMTIKDEDTLSFLTGVAVKAGTSEGDNFRIVQNNDEKLMAVWFNQYVINTVVLNKKNGLGVWTKSDPDFITYDAPHGSIIYMICR